MGKKYKFSDNFLNGSNIHSKYLCIGEEYLKKTFGENLRDAVFELKGNIPDAPGADGYGWGGIEYSFVEVDVPTTKKKKIKFPIGTRVKIIKNLGGPEDDSNVGKKATVVGYTKKSDMPHIYKGVVMQYSINIDTEDSLSGHVYASVDELRKLRPKKSNTKKQQVTDKVVEQVVYARDDQVKALAEAIGRDVSNIYDKVDWLEEALAVSQGLIKELMLIVKNSRHDDD